MYIISFWGILENFLKIADLRLSIFKLSSVKLSEIMIRAMTWQNQPNGFCAQRRPRSAWASAQSDQSSLSAWRKLESSAIHWAHSEDSDQTGWMPRLIWVFAGHTLILLVLSCCSSCKISTDLLCCCCEHCSVLLLKSPQNLYLHAFSSQSSSPQQL